MKNLREQFLLDPEVVFLNHGSFGATPIPVFKEYQKWQMRLENQPVRFLGREYDAHLLDSRTLLGNYVGADPNDLVYIPNATFGVNILARSLKLEAGDEVLTSDHEYGACDYTWEFMCKKTGAKYIHQRIGLPVGPEAELIEIFWRGVTPRTKVIFLSHITSSTAIRLPVEQICQRARDVGIITVIDGAHAMGQIPLNLESIGADFYISNCHKWALSPKGAAFLYAQRSEQYIIEPLVVSWGYGNDPKLGTGSRFIDIQQWTGTRDPAPWLAVPSAIQFMADNSWENIREECHELLGQAIQRICEFTDLPSSYPLDSDYFIQMGVASLPPMVNLDFLKKRLYEDYRVEVPLTQFEDKKFVRISVQCYNSQDDIDILVAALRKLIPLAMI